MHEQQHPSGTDSAMERLSRLRALYTAPERNETAIGAWAKEMRASRHGRHDSERTRKGRSLSDKFKGHCRLFDNSPRYADKEFNLTLKRSTQSPELSAFYRDEARLAGF